ncbi:hypothetical protein SAMN05216404_106175 [Nitrosospira multiformis]|uniref:Uncharacterized protein n=1 Tax=Nitrosospira multiformis TaxID=1231 RepID=A0A1H8IVG1_9PROT|nr:hypothetical protein [Nitrosospira multiformis]SEN71688.1 hypothetical protein SAMN05216404_106175 [Nitrosospira multiformis]
MSAISGTRRALKELVDGTIRVQIDIDPRFKTQFHQMFPNIDMPVAIAPLVSDFERQEEEKPKGGPLCRLAGIWCKDEDFQEWLYMAYNDGVPVDEEEAADWIRVTCGVASRSELDHNEAAAVKFQERIRAPYMEWMKTRK